MNSTRILYANRPEKKWEEVDLNGWHSQMLSFWSKKQNALQGGWNVKLNRFEKIAWIWSHHLHLQWKFKLLAGKFTWCNQAKHCWIISTNFLFSKVCWQHPAMFWLYLKQTSPSIIWIFTEGEGDGIKFRLPFKILSTQRGLNRWRKYWIFKSPLKA